MVDFNRLEALISERGISKKFLCDKAGKCRSYIAGAKNGTGSISDEALAIFANELQTSVEYLRGETDDPGYKKTPVATDGLNKAQREALELIKSMSAEQLRVFVATAKAMKK